MSERTEYELPDGEIYECAPGGWTSSGMGHFQVTLAEILDITEEVYTADAEAAAEGLAAVRRIRAEAGLGVRK